ncbi:MAG: glycosyltransferase [Snowella sp.]|nr:glycosyltransferase [Snowella sp.]
MKWLIVEDALRDQQGHWFEYISTFQKGLQEIGDQVTILADREAQTFILEELKALPALPPSIWHRMSDGANPLVRYLRLPVHGWRTVQAMKRFLATHNNYDVIFVPTVLVHHLLAWTWLIKRGLMPGQTQIILFFPNAPVQYDQTHQTYSWSESLTTKLLRYLLKQLTPEVQQRKVILGVETHPMQKALSFLTGLDFTYFPHPVEPILNQPSQSTPPKDSIVMASYGGARHEKGNDILYQAIAIFNQNSPDAKTQFILQCLEGFEAERELLVGFNNVEWINRYFQPGEYANYLQKTDVVLLPYRPASYCLRVSRVVIEAMVNGIIVLATEGTTLAEQAKEFGALVSCKNENLINVANSIKDVIDNYQQLQSESKQKILMSQSHFSVKKFRDCLIEKCLEYST